MEPELIHLDRCVQICPTDDSLSDRAGEGGKGQHKHGANQHRVTSPTKNAKRVHQCKFGGSLKLQHKDELQPKDELLSFTGIACVTLFFFLKLTLITKITEHIASCSHCIALHFVVVG